MNVESKNYSTILITVFLLLCGLTAVSFWISNSSLMNYPAVAWSAMIAVSIAKASLVLMFFMHLWWEKSWKYVLTVPALILASVLVLLLVPDIGRRADTYSQDRHENAAVPQTTVTTIRQVETSNH